MGSDVDYSVCVNKYVYIRLAHELTLYRHNLDGFIKIWLCVYHISSWCGIIVCACICVCAGQSAVCREPLHVNYYTFENIHN